MDVCKLITYVLCVLILMLACSSLGGGLYFIFGFHHMNQNILSTFDEAKTKVEVMIKTINKYPGTMFPNPPNVNSSDPLLDIHMDKIVHGVGYGLSALGVVLGTLFVTACVGMYRKSKRLQFIVITLTTILLVLEVTSFILREMVFDIIKDFFLHDLYHSFKSIRAHDALSIGWNIVMQKYQCCGVSGYLDFSASESFDDVWGEPFHTSTKTHPFVTALACCDSIFIHFRAPNFKGPCYDTDYLQKKGCFDVLLETITVEEYKMQFIVCGVFVIVIQMVFAVVTCINVKLSIKKHYRIRNGF